jgi:transcriptional regulator with XRE-family HTH domain
MAPASRTRPERVEPEVARTLGGALRRVRKAAGYRAVQEVARAPGCPAAQQTIYAYERGGLVPSLRQFLDLVEFYALRGDPPEEARLRGIAAIHAALASPAYGFTDALDMIRRLQPAPGTR